MKQWFPTHSSQDEGHNMLRRPHGKHQGWSGSRGEGGLCRSLYCGLFRKEQVGEDKQAQDWPA